MGNMISFIDLLRQANINVTDELKDGEIDNLHIEKATLAAKLYLSFPHVLPVLTLVDLKKCLVNYFLNALKVKSAEVIIRYLDNYLNKETISSYYDYCLELCIKSRQRFIVLKSVQTEIEEDSVVLYVANSDEEHLIEPYVREIKKMINDFGIKADVRISISPFVTSLNELVEENNKKIFSEMVREQEQFERTNNGTKPEEQKNKKFRYSPKATRAINKVPTPIKDLPSSNADLIVYNQKYGNGDLAIVGIIDSCEIRSITSSKSGETFNLFVGTIRQGNSFISVKTFINKRIDGELERFQRDFQVGAKVRAGGQLTYDTFMKDVVFQIQDITTDDTVEDEEKDERVDTAPVKRVELHAHSKMSVQDGVMDIDDYVSMAKKFGHSACAITDKHNVQGLPDFYNACKKNGIKPIFGVEGELVDEDKYKIALTENEENNKIDLRTATFVVYDLETTGFSSTYNEIIEIAAAKVRNGVVVDTFSTFVKPKREIGRVITELTSITNDDVRGARSIEEILPEFYEFFKGSILVAHNATFDNSHLFQGLEKLGIDAYNTPSIDTLQLAKVRYGHGTKLKKFNLKALCTYFDVELLQHHRAINDATATAYCFIKMVNDLFDANIFYYGDINKCINEEGVFDLAYPTHFAILAKNAIGKKNLYEIVSDSNTVHFFKKPLMLKSVVNKHREGILVGSGCIEGEVFNTAYEKSYRDLLKVMSFYDYIEVQPVSVCSVLKEKYQDDMVIDFIKDTIKTIIKAAKELGKIVVATGNVHQLTEDDLIVRKIYIDAPQIGGGVHPLKDILPNVPSMHFMTTDEMLEEFSFLGKDLAYEIVVENTNKIADMIEEFALFPKDLLIPADDMLKDRGVPSFAKGVEEITYSTARAKYGENLPQFIEDRINKELEVIIGKGYASIYYISYMLVKYSTDAGYVVGSRGSVGSSIVAYFMSITEVNGLPPHYHCPHCHFMAMKYTDEQKKIYPQSQGAEKFVDLLDKVETGYDLPDDVCPICGEKLERLGVDIPFETFLGTATDAKTPDIDLNFSGDFQAKAHEFCRSIFGVDHALRAGTVLTIAEKTAFGYVKKYFERLGQEVRQAEIENLVKKVQGVKRSTSQHPGGIVVFPENVDFSDVIPYQYPADDPSSSWRTTHFDYHKFENNLLKFDILGHDDPTMIRELMNFVERYPEQFDFSTVEGIPLLDPEVFSIFNSIKALGVSSDDLNGEIIGTTGIPEFGTNLAKDMLRDANPKTYADLLKISGLAHGTGVWNGNAKDFLQGNKPGYDPIPFSELIGCRDDIMVYLIHKGLPSGDAFKIMEKVRKGKGVSPEAEQEMLSYGVPKWYIESCKLIEYMFPKAHATAYVIMALRIAWFKVKKPLFYYAAFLSRRAKAYDVSAMTLSKEGIKNRIKELQDLIERREQTKKDEDTLACLKVVLEAVARGIKFKMIDINHSSANEFIIDMNDNSLLIPFSALDSLGEATAISVEEARRERPFSSKKDVLIRTKLNHSQFERLEELGAFSGLSDEDDTKLNLDFI